MQGVSYFSYFIFLFYFIFYIIRNVSIVFTHLIDTPWAEPTQHDEEFIFFVQHKSQSLPYAPWNRFAVPLLQLLLGILNIDDKQRLSIKEIKESDWYKQPQPMLTDGRCNNPVRVAERMISKLNLAGECLVDEATV